MKHKKRYNAFTLIEVLLSITIIASVLISGFYAITHVTIGKVRLVELTKIQKESFYFSEKLFELIKSGWVIDFEEYFNRSVVGNTTFSSGHYNLPTGYGNFGYWGSVWTTNYGSLIYYCISPDGTDMGTGWCLSSNNTAGLDHDGSPQRYGQYAMQFIDYNSDYNGDGGDENGNGNIIGDDDDKYIGQGPSIFNTNQNIRELYLISWDKQSRTLFRWHVSLDPEAPSAETCDFSNPETPIWEACLGTIEFLRLDAVDWWNDHDEGNVDTNGSQYDGITDTWILDPRFAGNDTTIAGSNGTNYWEKLFPDTINITNFEIFAYPNKDVDLAWKDSTNSINQSPYMRMKLTLTPSRKKRKTIKGSVPKVDIATTIALTGEFSQ